MLQKKAHALPAAMWGAQEVDAANQVLVVSAIEPDPVLHAVATTHLEVVVSARPDLARGFVHVAWAHTNSDSPHALTPADLIP